MAIRVVEFFKPVIGQELFFSTWYNRPALNEIVTQSSVKVKLSLNNSVCRT